MIAADLPQAFARLPPAWRSRLAGFSLAQEAAICASVARVSGQRPIAPDEPFRALNLVGPDAVRVVVFGQDPYPGQGHADGLAFSAPRGSRPSLRRIFEVLEADRPGWRRPVSGRLDAWAAQGVLLLNPTLSVEVGRPNSHTDCGWQALTSAIVKTLANMERPPAFMLWGSQAQSFWRDAVPDDGDLRVLRTRHPSNDYGRQFMAEGSHFAATRPLVDWWCLAD